MKNLFYVCAVTLSALALTACSNENEEAGVVENQENGTEFTISATMGADTRTYVTMDHHVYWNENDKIGVGGTGETGSVYGIFSLTEGSGTTTATFKGSLKGTMIKNDLQYAVYPSDVSYSAADNSYTFTLPDAYTYGDASNSPMYAVFGDNKSTLAFKHLCAMLRLKIAGIPSSGVKTLKLNSTANNYFITGTVKSVFSDEERPTYPITSMISDKSKTVSFTIPDGTPSSEEEVLVFDFPIPAVGDLPFNVTLNTGTGDEVIYVDDVHPNMDECGYLFEVSFSLPFSITGSTPSW